MSENEITKENKMGTMPVTPLLLNMSLPIMFSMLILAGYNIVDSFFVSKISEGTINLGEEALSAMAIAFPIQTLTIAFGIGTAVGVNALLAMKLGEKDYDTVSKIAVNGLFLTFCTTILFCLICKFAVDPYIKSQTSNPVIIRMTKEYLTIILYISLPSFLGVMSDRILQATGLTFYTMLTMLSGAIFNIIFDPLLIFGIGPFPRMGISGAAIATVSGQFMGFLLSIFFNLKINKEVRFKFKGFKPDLKIIGNIYKIAAPSILMQSVNSLTTYGMNLVLKSFKLIGDTAIAVYGLYFKLNSFVFMPLFGLTTGMVPIVSYNFGARKRKRIITTIKSTLMFAIGIMCIGIIIFEFFPEKLLSLFDAKENMMNIGKSCLRIIAPSFIGAAMSITFSSVFQAMGRAVYSMIISIIRQLAVLLPTAYLLALTGNINNVWFCFLIAEIFAISISAYYMHRLNRKYLRPMED